MKEGTRASWPHAAARHLRTRATHYLKLADRYKRAAVRWRDDRYLALAWGYLRLAADAVARMEEP